MRPIAFAAPLLLAFAFTAGCAEESGASVSNLQDVFAYGGTLDGKDGLDTYVWKNSMSKAAVSWGSSVHSGEIRLTIKDARGLVVYEETFKPGSSGQATKTKDGSPGDWTVFFLYKAAHASMGLSITASNA